MGAFFAVRGNGVADSRQLAARQDRSLRAQGFPPGRRVSAGGLEFGIYPKMNGTGGHFCTIGDSDFIFQTGTLFYKGAEGEPALRAFHADFSGGTPDWKALRGHYCIVLAKAGRISAITDPLGIYKVYANTALSLFSSSFLALAENLETIHPSAQEVYEYVFQGGTYGGRTVIDEIRTLGAGGPMALDTASAKAFEDTPGRAAIIDDGSAPPDLMDKILAGLRDYFSIVASRFHGRVDTALSGGYDSRLLLALLREQGMTPRLHVYGSAAAEDVRVAKAIAESEGLRLEQIDKSAHGMPEPDRFTELIERNFRFFDGYAADGIFDDGSDTETRRERCVNHELMLNGGGGEIFRNFFYLPDRGFTARQILWTFYSRYDPRACGSLFDEDWYLGSLEDKLIASIGTAYKHLSRRQVEALYPLFRCRFWMGRNNCINNRIGSAATPFIEPDIVADALRIPIAQKNAGAFEGRMIARIDPRLAGYPTDYGHDLSGRPPPARRLRDLSTRLRPPALRRFAYRIHHRRMDEPMPDILSRAYLARVMDVEFPYMRRFFRTEAVRDPEQMQRICSLEYLFQRLGASEPEPPG